MAFTWAFKLRADKPDNAFSKASDTTEEVSFPGSVMETCFGFAGRACSSFFAVSKRSLTVLKRRGRSWFAISGRKPSWMASAISASRSISSHLRASISLSAA